MKVRVVLIVLLAVCFADVAETPNVLSFKLDTVKEEYILGESILFSYECMNNSSKTITFAYNLSPLSPLMNIRVKGPIKKDCILNKRLPEWVWPAHFDLAPNQSKVSGFSQYDIGIVDEGKYEIWIEYDSTSMIADWDKIDAVRCKAESNHILIHIVKPIGIDAEAFAKHKNGCNQIELSESDILQKFPTSTYAAYIIYQSSGAKGTMASEPTNIAKAITCGSINYPESVPDDTGKWKGGWQSLTAENYPKWRDKWFDIVLKNHPDIWFADALRLRRAVEDYSHKRTESLLTDIETLAKTGNPDVAKKAQEILAALKSVEGEKKKEVETAAPKTAATGSLK